MRTFVLVFVLSAAAFAQQENLPLMASSSPAPEAEFSSSLVAAAPVAPMIKAATPVQPQLKAEQREKNRRNWYLLAAASHSASAFDAWTTNRALRNGSVELNPMLKPFAGSNSLYPVMQLGPAVTDFVGLRMRRSNRTLVRKLWWASGVIPIAHCNVCPCKHHRKARNE